MPTSSIEPVLLFEPDAAARFGLSRDYLYRLRTDGPRRRNNPQSPLPPGPPYIRIAGRVAYRPEDLTAWLAALASGALYARQSRGRGRPRKVAA